MEHQALYRKYRPHVFDDVYGQDHVTSILKFEAMEDKISHAYLFCGPRGTGKTTCAKILAKSINCEAPVNGNPCGKCFSCKSIDNNTATDVLEMDAASNTGVDYIREIRDEVTYTPAALKKRVYIIDEVHMLSIGAFNALLKTLEEPPAHVVFILATTEQHKLPPTVISRCQRFDFRRIPVDIIAARLNKIASQENIALTDDASQMIAKQAQGGLRDAINLLELCVGGKKEVDAERVKEALGISGIENAYNVAIAIKTGDFETIFSSINNVIASSKDIFVFWQELISFWRDMIVLKYSSNVSDYLDLTDNEKELLGQAADKFNSSELLYHCDLLDGALQSMNKIPQIKRLTAEMTLLKMSDAKLETSLQSLNSRITSLENELILLKTKNPGNIVSSQNDRSPQSSAAEIKTDESKSKIEKKDTFSNEITPQKELSELKISESDMGDYITKVGEISPMIKGFLNDAECFLSKDSSKAIINVKSSFAVKMLSTDENLSVLSDAFALCGVCNSRPVVKITSKEKNNESSDIEFENFN